MKLETLITLRNALNESASAINKLINEVAEEQEEKATWVSTKQASERTGLNQRTIQNWIRCNRVRYRELSSRRKEVALEDIERSLKRKGA